MLAETNAGAGKSLWINLRPIQLVEACGLVLSQECELEIHAYEVYELSVSCAAFELLNGKSSQRSMRAHMFNQDFLS